MDHYGEYGVDSKQEEKAMNKLLKWINPTFSFRTHLGKNLLPIGFFANVIDLGNGQGLALSMDGVGTKIIIAEKLKKYDTIGIDCVAMNVNDLLCVGAEPLSFVDYIATGQIDQIQIEELAKGLYEGAKQANVNIPGGEFAQVKELLHPGEHSFDLVGTAVGIVATDKIITGNKISSGDLIIGLHSSGIHSNGLTLARKLLLNEKDDPVLLNELLIPTRIYVNEIMNLLENSIDIKGMAHITGEGFLNILRLDVEAHYVIDNLPPTPPIFKLIQQQGQIEDKEMYKDFNMGIGFVVIVGQKQLEQTKNCLDKLQTPYTILGNVASINHGHKIDLLQAGITSTGGSFDQIIS
jgi:phosphoribosylformylglycinamidine cyclo-ligase